jgi:hypothetical protein
MAGQAFGKGRLPIDDCMVAAASRIFYITRRFFEKRKNSRGLAFERLRLFRPAIRGKKTDGQDTETDLEVIHAYIDTLEA